MELINFVMDLLSMSFYGSSFEAGNGIIERTGSNMIVIQ